MTSETDDDVVDILLVEDNPGDVRLTREAFDAASLDSELHVVRDGEAALDFLNQRGEYAEASYPDVVLLDLNLPRLNGMDVLESIKTDEDLRLIPVVILTGSAAEEDVIEGYERQAAAYLTKPVDPDEFVDLVRSFEEFWFTFATLPPAPGDP